MRGLIPCVLLLVTMAAGCIGDPWETPPQNPLGEYVIEMGLVGGVPGFVPEKAQVPVDAVVVWINKGGHQLDSEDGSIRSGIMNPHEGHRQSFRSSGEFTYFCPVHGADKMSGTIRVG